MLTALIVTFMGLDFAAGRVIAGLISQPPGSIQTGLIVLSLSLLTGLGVVAGLGYPNPRVPVIRRQSARV